MNEKGVLSGTNIDYFLSGNRTGFDTLLTVALGKKLRTPILVNKFGLAASSRGDLLLSISYIVIPAKSGEPQSAVHHYRSSFSGQEMKKIALFYRTGLGVQKIHIPGFTVNFFKKKHGTLMEVI